MIKTVPSLQCGRRLTLGGEFIPQGREVNMIPGKHIRQRDGSLLRPFHGLGRGFGLAYAIGKGKVDLPSAHLVISF